MSNQIYYEVSVGGRSNDTLRFNTYEEAKEEYEDMKTYLTDFYVGLRKVTVEYMESVYLESNENEEE